MMSSSIVKFLFAAVLLLVGQLAARAGTLQVEPVLIDVTAPGAASTVTLRNEGAAPVNVQIRLFRWSQVDGKEQLDPTDDVVASPPAVTLAPKANYVARIVRVTKRPISGEESYRVMIDQLPESTAQRTNAVHLLVRYSIPVFFGASERRDPAVAWTVAATGNKIKVTARNDGERRVRIASLNIRDAKGKTVSFGKGLTGYVLGKSTVGWTAPASGFATDGSVSVSAQSDQGPVDAVASVHSGR
jgi:fimbrial chaperone protein